MGVQQNKLHLKEQQNTFSLNQFIQKKALQNIFLIKKSTVAINEF